MDKKLTKEQQLFIDKTLEFAKELYDQNEQKINEAYRGQKKNRDGLLIEIAKILLSYNIADNILSLSAAEKNKLSEELFNLINANFKSELDFETKLTKNILIDVGKEKYNINNYIYSLGADFKLTQLDDEALEKIINTKVEGKLWSDRLYDNKNQMAKTLRSEVKKFLKGETNVNDIENKIKKKYNENAYETKRLVQDNICRVQEAANDIWQYEHGIKYVMYMATLDGHVCGKCAPYDTKVYELDKKPIGIPQHPFCRCVYISLVNKDWRPKTKLDNETKKNINWQSYQEWKENRSTMSGVSSSTKWLGKGEKITKEEFKNLRDYATNKGIALSEFKNFDGDVQLVKNAISDMAMIANKYPKLLDDKKKLTLKLNYYMEDEDFAQAKGHILNINGKAFRNKELLKNEYLKLSESGWFTPNTTYRAIIKHEMGHMVHDAYKINTISIGKDILNINNNGELFKTLKYSLSEYASIYSDGSEILSEVFAETYDSKNPREFSLKFMENLDKIIKKE